MCERSGAERKCTMLCVYPVVFQASKEQLLHCIFMAMVQGFPVGRVHSGPCCRHQSSYAWLARAPPCCRPATLSQTAAAEGVCLRGPQIDTRQAVKKTYYAIIPLCAFAARPCLLTGSKDAALRTASSPPEGEGTSAPTLLRAGAACS